MYDLRVGEGGFSLRPSKVKTAPDRLSSGLNGTIVVEASGQPHGLAWLLSLRPAGLNRPVIGRTGIAGLFDFELAYSREGSAPRSRAAHPPPAESVSVTVMFNGPDPCVGEANSGGPSGLADAFPAPSILASLQAVGLLLEPTMGPREFLVIDRVQRPSGN